MARGEKVYRGVLVDAIQMRDQYGNLYPARRLHYLKPYDKPGPAKASVTTSRKDWGKRLIDCYVEVSMEWTRLD